MEQEQIEFYEYLIVQKRCQIIQYKAVGIKAGNGLYIADFFRDNKKVGESRFVRLRNFESVHSFRIFSFNDDCEKYRKILLDAYATMIEKNRSNLEKQIQFFENLKSSE